MKYSRIFLLALFTHILPLILPVIFVAFIVFAQLTVLSIFELHFDIGPEDPLNHLATSRNNLLVV